ncbi:MAG TPA: ATP-binding protein [Anaerolineales bacterium]|nr:ATP-binding protein [Anaerolineales bacterium]HNB34993.1 ATP-binding protein [Anaerolineales bacterium]HNC07529.1 ATP-binding protein [Anaerolineales bacterium]
MPAYTFPASFDYLDEIRELVAETARAGGFSEKAIYSLQLAADEAASNIIEHAYEGISNASIYLTCDINGEEIVITMLDKGTPFDFSAVKEPNLTSDLSERQIGGLGVYLMRKLMDKVNYETTRAGNLLTMTKRRV